MGKERGSMAREVGVGAVRRVGAFRWLVGGRGGQVREEVDEDGFTR